MNQFTKNSVLFVAMIFSSISHSQVKSSIVVTHAEQVSVERMEKLNDLAKLIEKQSRKFDKNPFDVILKKTEGSKLIIESGTNVGGANFSSDLELEWCRSKVVYLEGVRKKAILNVARTGNHHLATIKIIEGMAVALKEYSQRNRHSSFTKMALERGLVMAGLLEVTSGVYNQDKAAKVFNIFNSYLNFVIEVVAKKLDIDTFIPFSINIHSVDLKRVEKRFIDYAQAQLLWATDTLTKVGPTANGVEPYSVGPAINFLKVSEIITLSTANDLLASFWRYRFSCSIERLYRAYDDVKKYNMGDTSDLIDDRLAVYFTRAEMMTVSQDLQKADTCY